MSKQPVICIATSRVQADSIIERLRNDGFSNQGISVLFLKKTSPNETGREKQVKAPGEFTAGLETGRGVLGWLAGIGTLAIPGIGTFVGAGPVMAALERSAAGTGYAGIIAEALAGMVKPESDAIRYEGRVRDGGILISVHSENSGEVKRAAGVFKDGKAQDVSGAGDAAAHLHPIPAPPSPP